MSERPTPGDRDRKTTPAATPLVAPVPAPPGLAPVSADDGAGPGSSPSNVVSWAHGRLRQSLPKLVGRCMSFSANPDFDDALVAAVSRFYGIEVDVATAETDILEDDFERVRFFPWFLWDFPLPNEGAAGATVGSRFLAEAELTDYERALARGLVESTVAFVEVVDVQPKLGEVTLADLYRRDTLVAFDPGLASDLTPGQLALVRLVRVERFGPPPSGDEGPAVLGLVDAIYAVLPGQARPAVESELDRLLSGAHDPTAVFKAQAPDLLDFAEHLLDGLSQPAASYNLDGEPLVLCRAALAGAEAETTAAFFANEPGSPFVREGAILVWREDERVVAWVTAQAAKSPRLLIEASSRERLERVERLLTRFGLRIPTMHMEMDLTQAVSSWFARGDTERWLVDPEVQAAFRSGLGAWLAQWPDQPHPALGKKTPRELAREPGGRDLLARLIARVRSIAGDEGATLERLFA